METHSCIYGAAKFAQQQEVRQKIGLALCELASCLLARQFIDCHRVVCVSQLFATVIIKTNNFIVTKIKRRRKQPPGTCVSRNCVRP